MSEADDKLRRLAYLDAMGIQVWQARGSAAVEEVGPQEEAPAESLVNSASTHAAPPVAEEAHPVEDLSDWEALAQQVAHCTRCDLHTQRTQAVFGVGSHQAQWMIIGEAPGADEDRLGEPFVGRAGQLLNLMLQAIGLKREEVYIANIVKCRPPNNRDPKPEEVAACEPYLKAQIELLKPRIILAVGRVSAHNLLRTQERVGALRGRVHRYADTDIPVVVTYHPAYLLRSPHEKRKAWEDLLLARNLLRQEQEIPG